MTNEELAKKAIKNLLVMMSVKWGIILGLNAIFRRAIRKAEREKREGRP